MIPIKSSNVESYEYNHDLQELTVKFLNGGLYRYAKVPQHKVDALLAHDSFGTALNSLIKGSHDFTKIR